MPVSVQISLVPLPLKSVCVVSAWSDMEGWAWSSAGALAPACREGRGAGLAHRGVLQAPPARCGPQRFVSVVRERGAWSHEFIFVHAFLIKRKSECLWFNCFGAGIDFFVFFQRRLSGWLDSHLRIWVWTWLNGQPTPGCSLDGDFLGCYELKVLPAGSSQGSEIW